MRTTFALLTSFLFLGCNPPGLPVGCESHDGRAGTCGLGEACVDSLDCASSDCEDGFCGEGCTRAADCAEGELCFGADDARGARRWCSAACPTMEPWHVVGDGGGRVCFEGTIQRCQDLADLGPVCDLCGCRDGDRCIDPEGLACRTSPVPCECRPPQPVGGPCTSSVECLSLNCSGTSASTGPRHCQEPAGTVCAAGTDCVHCTVPEGAIEVACRQSCERDADCMGGICIADQSDPTERACYDDCTVDGQCGPREPCIELPGDARQRRYCAPAS